MPGLGSTHLCKNNNVDDDDNDDLLLVAKVVLVIPVANQTVGEEIDSSERM